MLNSDNQAARPNHAHPELINTNIRRKIAEALGDLTLQNIQANVRADAYEAEFHARTQDYELLAADINTLRAQIDEARDLSKLDLDTLALELKHRGYEVTASSAGRTRSESVNVETHNQTGGVTAAWVNGLPQDAQPIDEPTKPPE